MAKKRIVAAVTNDLTFDRRMIRICSTLVEAGYLVLLVGRKLPESQELINQPFEQKRIKCIFRTGLLFYAEYNLRLFFFLMHYDFDLGNSTDADTLLAIGLACQLRKKIHVHDAHEYYTEVPELTNRKAVQWIWMKIERIFIPRTKLAYTVSESIAEVYTQLFKVKFAVIRNLPPLKANPSSIDPRLNTVIYQGALNKGRGLEALIEAMCKVDAKLAIVGDGDLTNELHALTRKLKLEDKITFLGMINPEQLSDLTAKAKIGVNLCENIGLNYYFALSNKGFDYIHANLPAITNNFPEYIKLNNRYETMLLTDCNSEEISAAINKLLNDSEYYQRLKNNCVLAQKELNWQKESVKLKELYANIS